jgi:hypothetical protein
MRKPLGRRYSSTAPRASNVVEKIGGTGRKCPTEHVEQSRVVQWCRAKYGSKSIFAIPNAGKMSYGAVNHFKSEGRTSGVPDLFIPGRHGCFLGLFIEMKREYGSVTSPEQMEWIEALKNVGYYACICRGFDEAVKVISDYKSDACPICETADVEHTDDGEKPKEGSGSGSLVS